jgi:hypothetical protein
MATRESSGLTCEPADSRSPLESEVVEVSLLLSGRDAAVLEATAHSQGLTAGQMLRRLIQEHFARYAQPRPA